MSPLLVSLLVGCVPSFLTFGVGLIIGYGKATARVAVMENQIADLTRQVNRLENLMLYGSTAGKPTVHNG